MKIGHANKGKFAEPLDGVGVEKDAIFGAKRTNLGHRLDGAQFVVGGHNAHQHRIRPNCPAHGIRRHTAHAVHREEGNLKPVIIRKIFTGMKHSVMFNGRGDDMPPMRA